MPPQGKCPWDSTEKTEPRPCRASRSRRPSLIVRHLREVPTTALRISSGCPPSGPLPRQRHRLRAYTSWSDRRHARPGDGSAGAAVIPDGIGGAPDRGGSRAWDNDARIVRLQGPTRTTIVLPSESGRVIARALPVMARRSRVRIPSCHPRARPSGRPSTNLASWQPAARMRRDSHARSGARRAADRLHRRVPRVPVGHPALARARLLPHLRRPLDRRAARLDRRVHRAGAEALRRHAAPDLGVLRARLRRRPRAAARSSG